MVPFFNFYLLCKVIKLVPYPSNFQKVLSLYLSKIKIEINVIEKVPTNSHKMFEISKSTPFIFVILPYVAKIDPNRPSNFQKEQTQCPK